MDAQVIATICKRAVKNKFPHDTEVLRVNYNVLTNNFEFVISSNTFDEVEEGQIIPQADYPMVSQDILK